MGNGPRVVQVWPTFVGDRGKGPRFAVVWPGFPIPEWAHAEYDSRAAAQIVAEAYAR